MRKAAENGTRSPVEEVFHSLREALIAVDTDSNVIELNAAAQELLGVNREIAVGMPVDLLFKGRDGIGEAVERVVSSREPVELKIESGQPLILKAIPLKSAGEVSGAVLVIRAHKGGPPLASRVISGDMVGASPAIKNLFKRIDDLAAMQTTVLISGESGTGKELVADALHRLSPRRVRPLVKVNCAALSEALLESELFGHVRGAFTGAVRDRVGRFELADKGTILLDEIGEIPVKLQLKLLRVLQQKEFERVGDSVTRRLDVRIIAATNSDLKKMVGTGRFREDLYYRLNVAEITMPPLRERQDDIPLLSAHFLLKLKERYEKPVTAFSQAAACLLKRHLWPGNVRELENAVEHAFAVCRGEEITPEDLPEAIREAVDALNAGGEREALLKALEDSAWNKSKAARKLGISRRTVYRKMERYKLKEE